MNFSDIHIHALFGVDDGANTEAEMYAMVSAAYAEGVRTLCCTPHFAPRYFGDNSKKVDTAFRLLTQYVGDQYPDMDLYLGNELRYGQNCLEWLKDGLCHTLNHTRYVLVDFMETEAQAIIVRGMERLLNAGYLPVLAHAERYRSLGLQELRRLRDNGVVVQVDTQSVLHGFDWGTQRRSRKLLAANLVDVISSDAHDLKKRPPGLRACYNYIVERWGKKYANALCETNALRLLTGSAGRED